MKDILTKGFSDLNIPASDEQKDTLVLYARLLQEWNEKINLTAICDDEGIAVKHFLDSAAALNTGYVKGSVIDVGTGAGFPGMVLKILKPDISLTLLDSLNKRINFLKTVSEQTGVPAEFVHARAEDGGRMMRAKFDTAVSRAVANMTVLSELCLPFLKIGGYFLALKGPSAEEELADAKRAIYVLGGETCGIFPVNIPGYDLHHKIIIIKKVRQTPQQYPRKAGIASKNPIGSCYNLKKKPTF